MAAITGETGRSYTAFAFTTATCRMGTQASSTFGAPQAPYRSCTLTGSLVDGLLLLRMVFISCKTNTQGSFIEALSAYSVDPEGFEPSAFSMPLRRAPNCAMGPCMLLSLFFDSGRLAPPVDLEGFEPSTSSVRLKRAPNCATGPLFRVEKFYPKVSRLSRTSG